MKSRKLPMEKRKSQKEISVTFTKRRQGLFNKAAEVSTFCDAQIAVLVSSPSKQHPKRKIYSFGHSSVPSVLRAFLSNSRPVSNPISDDLNGAGSTGEEVFSVLDDFQKSDSVEELSGLVEELEKIVDLAKRNPNYNVGTSNSDLRGFFLRPSVPVRDSVASNFGNHVFAGDGNYDLGTSYSDSQSLFLRQCVPIRNPVYDDFAFAGNGNGAIAVQDLSSESAAGKFSRLVEGWGKRNPNYESGTSNSDLQGFFLPHCDQISGDLVSPENGSDSTVSQALLVVNDPEISELSCFVQAIKRNSNYHYGTRNSDQQVNSDSGSGFHCNSTNFSSNESFGILQESSSLVAGNYSTMTAVNQLINPLGSAESMNSVPNFECSNPFGSNGIEGSSKSIMEEDKSWSFNVDDDGLLVANDYEDSNVAFVDYWPASL